MKGIFTDTGKEMVMNQFWKELAKRKKAAGGLAAFLALMFLLTLISKGIYASKLTRVTTDKIQRTGISHQVETQGSVKSGKSIAVNTLSGLRVEEVFVQRGDKVEADSPLFRLDMQDIRDKAAEGQLQINKLELMTQSSLENEELARIKDETLRKRAAEDYVRNVDAAQEKINDAKKELDEAKDKLQKHKDNRVSVTSEKKREKEEDSYKDWKKKGNKLVSKVADAEDRLSEAEKNLADGTGTQDEVDAAKDDLKAAQRELAEYEKDPRTSPDFTSEDAQLEAWRSKRDALEDAVETAQKNYDEAVKNKETVILEAQRALEDVQGNVTSDSTVETNQLDIAFQRENLAKYQQLLQKEGIIYAKEDGVVTGISVSPGERTPDGACVLYADLSNPLQFEATLTKEEKKYVDLGDTIEVQFGNSSSIELQVDYLMPDETNTENYQLLCNLPDGKGTIGESGTMRAQRLSEKYNCCIPIEALHSENERYYIYVVEEKDTILGKELSANKRWVKVLDKNDKLAALEPGVVDEESKIIVSSDKELKDGDIVRYKE